MPFEEKKHNFAFLVIILIVIAGVIFVCFGKKIERIEGIHTWIFGDEFMDWDFNIKSTVSSTGLIVPPKTVEWCKIQEIRVDDDKESPIRHRIIGYDNKNKACVTEYTGFSCNLQKEVVVTYAYTGIVGGEIVWVMTDGIYGDVSKYKQYIEDLDKERIENKPCISDLYEGV